MNLEVLNNFKLLKIIKAHKFKFYFSYIMTDNKYYDKLIYSLK